MAGTQTNPDPADKKFAGRLTAAAGGFIAAGVLLSIVVFFHHLTLVPVAVMLSAASGGLGALLGFLFGVPKLVDSPAEPPPDPTVEPPQQLLELKQRREKIAKQRLLFNTNLGQVSDWVTKIVIGLGIAQFNKILEGSRWLGGRFGDVFDQGLDPAAGATFGMTVVISSVTFGFMLTYLWTTVRLPQVWSGV
jgi:hypothetical protein